MVQPPTVRMPLIMRRLMQEAGWRCHTWRRPADAASSACKTASSASSASSPGPHRLGCGRDLAPGETRHDVLRAVPVEMLQGKQESALHLPLAARGGKPRGGLRIGSEAACPDAGVQLHPAAVRVVHQDQRRPVVPREVAKAAVGSASRGTGVTRVLHYQCDDALHRGSLRLILTQSEPGPVRVDLIDASRGGLPLEVRVFPDFAAVRLGDRLKRVRA